MAAGGGNEETHHHRHKGAYLYLQATSHLRRAPSLHLIVQRRKHTKNARARGHEKGNELAHSAAKPPPPTIRTTPAFQKSNSTQTGKAFEIGLIACRKAMEDSVCAPLLSVVMTSVCSPLPRVGGGRFMKLQTAGVSSLCSTESIQRTREREGA